MKDITRQDVLGALAEFDQIGRDAFLDKYKMGKATVFVIRQDGRDYDSKAIFAAAHGHHPGLAPLKAVDFSGGEGGPVKHLRKLGFNVPPKSLDWTRDELILACDLSRQNNWKWMPPSDPRVGELSELLIAMPIYPLEMRGPAFRNTNSVVLKMQNISTQRDAYAKKRTKGNVLDAAVLRDFEKRPNEMIATAEAIRTGIRSGQLQGSYESLTDIDDIESEAPEGRLLERKHFVRERDRKKRQEKIDEFRRKNAGKLVCEICSFDFKERYGEHGEGYIECHHIVPLHASGETKTKLGDLILICSNCHRMIHRRTPWLKPEELRELIDGATRDSRPDG